MTEMKILNLLEEGLDFDNMNCSLDEQVEALRRFFDNYNEIRNLEVVDWAFKKHGTNLLGIIDEISFETERRLNLVICPI